MLLEISHTRKKKSHIVEKTKIRQDYKMKHFFSNNCNWLVILDKLLQFSEKSQQQFFVPPFLPKNKQKKANSAIRV